MPLIYQRLYNLIQRYYFLMALIFLLLSRLFAMYFIPLNESTEARYGEIARKMLETGNWVTLLHDYNSPFWAKPPLSTWLSASFMKVIGINEFAARLPALLLSIGILGLIWDLAKKHSGKNVANVAVLILASCFYFLLNAGTVMTDPALLFCTTLSLVAFWHVMHSPHSQLGWGYAFFIGLGLGMLAKGFVALVLIGLPLFFWISLRHQWNALWRKFPWFKGSCLFLIIALPWYILAEYRTPGFLNYFIIGEHISRFCQAGWSGNKYGFSHIQPYGMIWAYALLGIFPWSIPGFLWFINHKKNLLPLSKDDDGWTLFLFLSILSPLLFFTFSKNVIYPYVFPILPSFALLYAELWNRFNACRTNKIWLFNLSLLSGIIFIVVTNIYILKPEWIAKSQKPVILLWKKQHPSDKENLVYWAYRTNYSAQFYSSGKVKMTLSLDDLVKYRERFLVISEEYLKTKSPDLNENKLRLCQLTQIPQTCSSSEYCTPTHLGCQKPIVYFRKITSLRVAHNTMFLLKRIENN